MFVGEAPGADEDVQGIPFVGRAGQLLTKIIEAIGLRRDDVYIANVIKCRPPENRNPEPDEVETCEPFLFQQIDRIQPKVIVALGTFAAKALLKTQDPISRLRGRAFDYRGAKLIPTFHPAFLLRSPDRKRDVWEDMKKVRALLDERAVTPARPARVRSLTSMRLVRVAVPVPALDSLTYSLPDDCPTPVVGARVLVPLGSRVLTGCVVDERGRRRAAGVDHQAGHRGPRRGAVPAGGRRAARDVGRRLLRLRHRLGAGGRDAADGGGRRAGRPGTRVSHRPRGRADGAGTGGRRRDADA